MAAAKKADWPSAETFAAEAAAIGCAPEILQALALVEARHSGAFQDDGQPTILFERHKFSQFTAGRFDGERAPGMSQAHSLISSRKPGGYGPFSAQYDKLHHAIGLDRLAALKSASWGLFQLMGFNYDEAGFDSVEAMVAAMRESVDRQFAAWRRWACRNRKLVKALRERDFPTISLIQNGKNYRLNKYDEKLERAWRGLAPGGGV